MLQCHGHFIYILGLGPGIATDVLKPNFPMSSDIRDVILSLVSRFRKFTGLQRPMSFVIDHLSPRTKVPDIRLSRIDVNWLSIDLS